MSASEASARVCHWQFVCQCYLVGFSDVTEARAD